jgi:hypothetical protein
MRRGDSTRSTTRAEPPGANSPLDLFSAEYPTFLSSTLAPTGTIYGRYKWLRVREFDKRCVYVAARMPTGDFAAFCTARSGPWVCVQSSCDRSGCIERPREERDPPG